MPVSLADANAHINQIRADIERLVASESPSDSKLALDRTCDLLVAITRERLGEPDAFTRHRSEERGDVVEMGYGGSVDKHVLLVGHYDTVWPIGTLAAWEPSADASRWSLPGIQDMKSGLVQAIWALKLIDASGLPRPSVTLIFNGDEEIGSPASRNVIRKAARSADAAFVLEAFEGCGVKVGRKGIGNAVVTVRGVESHAGNAPEQGASAILGLSEFCLAADRVNDFERGITVNVGRIEGGTSANTVAGKAQARLDLRYLHPGDGEAIEQALRAITVSNPRVSVEVEMDWHRPAMPPTEANVALFDLVQAEAAELGREIGSITVGGGSDANLIADEGTPVLCGMGPAGENSHARDEYIDFDSLGFFVALLANSVGAAAAAIG